VFLTSSRIKHNLISGGFKALKKRKEIIDHV